MGDTLFVGPWFGEFGHELMWVGMARAEARKYQRVIACSHPGSAPLYRDFVHQFHPHGIRCEGVIASATAATMPSRAEVEGLIVPSADVFRPREYQGVGPAEWVKYGRQGAREPGLVMVHGRNRAHVPERNWPRRNWNQLARLMLRHGVATRIVCVGLREQAVMVEGALDLRGAPLEKQMDAIARAEFAVGPSSGPMHLSEHCGTPVLVWCGGGESERRRTARRYISEWNPHRTLAHPHQYASWQPTVETVWLWLQAFLKDLRK